MPHATGPQDATDDEDDEALIRRVLNPGDPTDLESGIDLQRDLEPGEKADDAVDFADLSDDDLAEDEEDAENTQAIQSNQTNFGDAVPNGLDVFMQDRDFMVSANGNDLENDGMDDLFGDNPSSPLHLHGRAVKSEDGFDDPDILFGNHDHSSQNDTGNRPASSPSASRIHSPFHHGPIDFKDAPLSREQQLQMELFQMSRPGQENLPAPPENQEELLASLWPKFERGKVPKFIDLLPPKKARYVGKIIPKLPKPVNPTKISIELAPDQEKSFKVWPTSNKRSHEDYDQSGVESIRQIVVSEKALEGHADVESDVELDAVGGLSWQDLQLACEDWDLRSLTSSPGSLPIQQSSYDLGEQTLFAELDDGEDFGLESPQAKVIEAPLQVKYRG